MGDKIRGKIFGQYIKKTFPRVKRLISVADGNLVLSREIYRDYEITIYDPDMRNHRLDIRPFAKLRGKKFTADCPYKCDLIVGLHPDQATAEILDYAIRTQTPCIIVPCCLVGRYSSECSNKARWVKFLANKFIQKGWRVHIDRLPFKGDNLAIRAVPNYY